MLAEGRLPQYFWAEAVNTACFTQNRSLVNKFHNKTPYELWKGRIPNISFFKIFGCKCYVLYNGGDHRGKFEEKADEGIFIGYAKFSKAFRVFNKRLLKIVESVHVSFDEFDLIKPHQANGSNDSENDESSDSSNVNATQILCLHLQRASVNIFGEEVKLQGHVSFPLILNMTPFLKSDVEIKNCQRNLRNELATEPYQLPLYHSNYLKVQCITNTGKNAIAEDGADKVCRQSPTEVLGDRIIQAVQKEEPTLADVGYCSDTQKQPKSKVRQWLRV